MVNLQYILSKDNYMNPRYSFNSTVTNALVHYRSWKPNSWKTLLPIYHYINTITDLHPKAILGSHAFYSLNNNQMNKNGFYL